MPVRFIIEFNGHSQVFSLDEFAKSILEAIRTTIRQEVERPHSPGATPATSPAKDSEVSRPVALSKAQAAQALGVSVRTIDICIAQPKIPVLPIGRTVLI